MGICFLTRSNNVVNLRNKVYLSEKFLKLYNITLPWIQAGYRVIFLYCVCECLDILLLQGFNDTLHIKNAH